MAKIRLDQTDLNARNSIISGVASATSGTDAVNFNQLQSSLSGVGSGSGEVYSISQTGGIAYYSASASVSANPFELYYDNGNIFNKNLPTLSGHLSNKFYIDSISSNLSSFIYSTSSSLYFTITSISSDLNSSIITSSSNLFNYINSNTGSLFGTITSVSSNLYSYVNSTSSDLFNTITSVSSNLNSSIITSSSNLFNYINSNTSSLFSTITSVSSNLNSSLTTVSSNLYNYITSVSSSLSSVSQQSTTAYVSVTGGNQTVSGNKTFDNLTVTNPTDGSLNDGFFDSWVAGQSKLQDMLDDISEAFLDLAPVKAGLLTSNTLTLTNTTKYSAILPSGLSSSWYVNATSGTTISDYVVDGVYNLASPNTSTSFRSGKASDNSTRGILYHYRSTNSGTSQVTSYSVSSGIGSSGTVQVTAASAYNTFWFKTNAQINVTQTAEGYEGHYMSHTEAGTSNQTNFYFDAVNSTPSFLVTPIVATATVFYKYMSNVPYYTSNSVFNVSFTGGTGIFNRAYHPTNVAVISATGGSSINVNPSSVPNYLATFPASGAFTLNTANRSTNIKAITVSLYKPTGTVTSATGSISYGINTFGTSATTTAEYFLDETYRVDLTVSAGATATWNSQTTFDASNTGSDLQVRNGFLVYPVTGDYVGLITNPTGDKFYRRIGIMLKDGENYLMIYKIVLLMNRQINQ